MTQNIFIGIDGGGTKTKLRMEDEKGNLLAQSRGGPANIRLSVTNSWNSIYGAVRRALKSANLEIDNPNYRFHVGFGLAGTEISDAIHEFLATPHPFQTVVLKSDAYVACLGAHEGSDGSIIIIGTGVVGYKIDHQETLKVGGWGFPHGDEGGGAWLGMQAMRHTLQALDLRGETTPLTEAIFDFFDCNLIRLVVWANRANSSRFAEIAPFVIEYVKKEDPLALRLIRMAAEEIDKVAVALFRKGERPLPCAFFGGISPYIKPWISDRLRKNLVPRKHDATKGCIYVIRKKVLGRI